MPARRLWGLDSPRVRLEGHTLMHGLNEDVILPVPSFVIEHSQGVVLFDTGMPVEAMDDPVGALGGMGHFLLARGWESTSRMRIDRQLADLGIGTQDVTHVITSHLHLDHCGGHHLFPDAKHYVGHGEWGFARCPTPMQADAYLPSLLDRLGGLSWRVVPDVDIDLFGDGSIHILALPGHTPGSLGLRVRLPHSTFILSGDVVHLRAAWDREFHFPIDVDSRSALNSIRRMKRIAEAEDADVWIGHDIGDWERFGHVTEGHR